jgi:hypothetical protein
MDQLLHAAQRLHLHASYALVTIGIGVVAAALMLSAEIWGSARARRRTERAIADAQRAPTHDVGT